MITTTLLKDQTNLFDFKLERMKANSTSKDKDKKTESRNATLTSQVDVKPNAKLGNFINNFVSENTNTYKASNTQESQKQANFGTNFERNLNTDPIEAKLTEKNKKQDAFKMNSNATKQQTATSMESLINRITPRVNVDYGNYISSFDAKPKKKENTLFSNYNTSKSEKDHIVISNTQDVSKSTHNYGLNQINKPSESNAAMQENVTKLIKQLKFANESDLSASVLTDLKILSKLIDKLIKK